MGKDRKPDRKLEFVPTLKINHNYMVVYNTVLSNMESSYYRIENLMKDGEAVKTYAGDMSEGSRKRLQAACELMIAVTDRKVYYHPLTKKRLTFRIGLLTTTLSAPQENVTDREIKKELLEPYLRKLRKYGLRNYVWKAERQNNGNIHFHIFVDCYIDMYDARNIWNRLQSKFHFITRFEKKNGHRDPNSTDIKAIHSDKDMIKYMLKYMIKNVDKKKQLTLERNENAKDIGKIWDCSRPLKTKNLTAEFATDEDHEKIKLATFHGDIKEVKLDYCYVYIFINPDKKSYLPEKSFGRYESYINEVKELTRLS